MAVKEIIRMGHPTLRKVAEPYPIDKFDSPEFRQLIIDMQETLHAASGIGLAAPQINLSSQVLVIEVVDTSTRYGEVQAIPFSVFVNPKLTVLEPECTGYWEGCLSVPGLMGFVERPQHIAVEYLNARGENRSLEFKGFLATVFQNEFDHLNGTLFVDRIDDLSLFSYDQEYRDFHLSDRVYPND